MELQKRIYLDWAATSPPDQSSLATALARYCEAFGNPSSRHWAGSEAARLLEEARSLLASALGVHGGRLVFTGSGTEADHIPLLSLLRRQMQPPHKPLHLVMSAIEHDALDCLAGVLEKAGISITRVRPGPDGCINPTEIAASIRKDTALVAVMAVNNETGAIQDTASIGKAMAAVSRELRIRTPWFHVDAVQALGRIPLEGILAHADSVAFSAHKIQGPKGIGALWLRQDIDVLACGGGQEGGIRSGTENTMGALAFALAAQKALAASPARHEHACLLEKRLLDGLQTIKGVVIVPERTSSQNSATPGDRRHVPGIISVAFPGLGGETMVRALSDRGIAVSTGSACSSNKKKKGRRILDAMGVPEELSFSAIRISTGPVTTLEEIDCFLEEAEAIYRKLKT